MTAEQVLERIRKVLGLPNLDANARMGKVVGWDSLRHIRLMLALEKELGIKVPVHRFGALTSVEAITAFFSNRDGLAA